MLMPFETACIQLGSKLSFIPFAKSKKTKKSLVWVIVFAAIWFVLLTCVSTSFIHSYDDSSSLRSIDYSVYVILGIIYLISIAAFTSAIRSTFVRTRDFRKTRSEKEGTVLLAYVAGVSDWQVTHRDTNDNTSSTSYYHAYLLTIYLDGKYHYLSTVAFKGSSICQIGNFTVIRYISDDDFTLSAGSDDEEVWYHSDDITISPPAVSLDEDLVNTRDSILQSKSGIIQSNLNYIRANSVYTRSR